MTELYAIDHPLSKINHDELMKFIARLPITHDRVELTDAKNVKDANPPASVLTVGRRNDPFIPDEMYRLRQALEKLGFSNVVLKWNKKCNGDLKRYELRFYLYT